MTKAQRNAPATDGRLERSAAAIGSLLGVDPVESPRLSEALGSSAVLRAGEARVVDVSALPDSGILVLLSRRGRFGAIYVPSLLANDLITTAVGLAPGIPDASPRVYPVSLSQAEHGILLYLAACGLADAHAGRDPWVQIQGSAEGAGPLARLGHGKRFASIPIAIKSSSVSGEALLLVPLDQDLSDLAAATRDGAPGADEGTAFMDVILGCVALNPSAIRGLETGDAVLLDQAGASEKDGRVAVSFLVLLSGSAAFSARIASRGCLEITHRFDAAGDSLASLFSQARAVAKPSALQATIETPHADTGRDFVDDPPVEVAIALGRLSLEAGKIAGLGPGSAIETGTPVDGPVMLCAWGKTFAEGELVAIQNRVGVKITSLRK